MYLRLMVTCILEENGTFFVVTKMDDAITLKIPITANLATLFLALGVPRYE